VEERLLEFVRLRKAFVNEAEKDSQSKKLTAQSQEEGPPQPPPGPQASKK
jgi:hypothetical protein